MREQIFETTTKNYKARVWEPEEGVFAEDVYSIKDGIPPEKYDTWDEAVKVAESCVKSHETASFDMFCHAETKTPLSDNGDVASWGFTELYPHAEEKLRKLLAGGDDFDTGYGGSKHELMSMRVAAKGDVLYVAVHCEMDDIPALIYDGVSEEDEELLTDDVLEAIEETLSWEDEFVTETVADARMPRNATYEELLEKLGELTKINNAKLENSFELCKTITMAEIHPERE